MNSVARGQSRTGSVVAAKFAARAILVQDGAQEASRRLVHKVAAECRVELKTVKSAPELERELNEHKADLVLISSESRGAATLCELVREKSGVRTAVVGLCRSVNELAYGEFLLWGGDDLTLEDCEQGLRARLRSVRDDLVQADNAANPVVAESMKFLVYGPECADAGPVARQLRHAGHQVIPFRSLGNIQEQLESGELVRLVIDARSPGAITLVKMALETPSCVNVVMTCAPQLIGELRRRYASAPQVTVIDSYAPPDTVLLVVNDMKRAGRNQRAAERALYSTLVAFRSAGHGRDELGFAHNISEGGLYVRTLVKPETELVWIEVTPPGSPDLVRLEARVAWRTPLTRHRQSGVPTGFGAQIVDGTRSSLQQWKAGYLRLMELHENRRQQGGELPMNGATPSEGPPTVSYQ